LKIMGLDPGTRRVGVALSDDLGLTANPLTTLPGENRARLLAAIENLAGEHKISRIVVGVPRRTDGSAGPEAQAAEELAAEIRDRLRVEVVCWDERFSTAAVERMLVEADLSRKKRKEVRDQAAAAYILQGYLDSLAYSAPGDR